MEGEPPSKRGRPAGPPKTAYVGYKDGSTRRMAPQSASSLGNTSQATCSQQQGSIASRPVPVRVGSFFQARSTQQQGPGIRSSEDTPSGSDPPASQQSEADPSPPATADFGGGDAIDDSLDFNPEVIPLVTESPSRASNPAVAPLNAQAADPILEKYCSQLLSKCRELPPGVPLSEDSQGQASFCVPAVSLPSGDVDWTRFEFPGLKVITLGENGLGAVWWCSCSDNLVLQRSLFEGLSKTVVDRTFLAGLVGQCYHLKVLLRIGSTLGLQIEDLCRRQLVIPPALRVAELEVDTEVEGERLVSVTSVPLPWSEKDGLPTVLVGCASRGYAVVRKTSRGTWACTTCSGSGRIKCWHVQAQVEEATGSAPPSRPGLTAAEFEERLRRALDLSTGMRRLTCLSTVQIPEPHLIGPELADLLKRRGALELRFPLKCSIRSELGGLNAVVVGLGRKQRTSGCRVRSFISLPLCRPRWRSGRVHAVARSITMAPRKVSSTSAMSTCSATSC